MGDCNIKRCAVATIVVAVVYFGLDMLVWHVILWNQLQENANLWRPIVDMQGKMWVAYVGYVVFAAIFNWIFCKGLESGKCPKMQGLKFGAVIGLLVWGAGNMLQYPFCPMTDGLYIGTFLTGVVEYVILGFVAGLVCQCCGDKTADGGRCCS